jgi:hypothetical protein
MLCPSSLFLADISYLFYFEAYCLLFSRDYIATVVFYSALFVSFESASACEIYSFEMFLVVIGC